eukprot:2452432-Pyramimonas_sp.AAC.1
MTGPRQSVPRGELRALLLAAEYSAGSVVYTTDNTNVANGWAERRYLQPEGVDADLWHRLGA